MKGELKLCVHGPTAVILLYVHPTVPLTSKGENYRNPRTDTLPDDDTQL
jgi:hypothetical protein